MSVIGLRVGPFEIAEPAIVPEEGRWYLARRTGITRRQPSEVLVCLLPPDAPADARAALQRRFEALRAVEDPRIPEPVAYYEGTGALAVAAAQGAGLDRIIEARRDGTLLMTPATLLDIVLEVAETVQHIHHKGKIHGHLSPESVLLAPDGKIWIWGLSTGPATPPAPRWCPPERARGEPATEATDQWGLAALAAALITGRPPWTGDDPAAEALRAEISPIVEPVERQWPALGRALRRMLDPRAANRFPNMHPVRQELLALARKAGGTSDRRELASRLATRAVPQEGAAPTHFEASPPEELAPSASPAPAPQEDPAPSGPPAEAAPAEPPAPAPPPAAREPDDEIPVAVLSQEEEEPARRAGGRLPEEPIPVVRPEVRGEVPVARLGEDVAGREPSVDARLPASSPVAGRDPSDDLALAPSAEASSPPEHPELPPQQRGPGALPAPSTPQQADVEPSEATVLFDASKLAREQGLSAPNIPPADETRAPMDARDPFDPSLLATPMYPDRRRPDDDDDDDDDEEENVTVVFDATLLGGQIAEAEAQAALAHEGAAGPTMVPGTDASDPDDDDEDVTVRFDDGLDAPSEPGLGDLDDVFDEPTPPESEPSLAVRAAPVLVAVMLVLMLAWLFLRFA